MRGTINHLFHSDILDIMTGYRAFSYRFVKTYPVLSKGFEIETDMSVHAIYRNMLTSNVVVTYRDRPAGSESKLNTGRDGIKVLMTIARLYKNYKPLSFFTILALILMALSIIFVTPVLREFLTTGLVPRFPTLITCLFGMLAGLLLFICGLILSSLQEKDKRDFEYQLVETEARFMHACSVERG